MIDWPVEYLRPLYIITIVDILIEKEEPCRLKTLSRTCSRYKFIDSPNFVLEGEKYKHDK